MGNRFGNYKTVTAAETELVVAGFEKVERDGYTVYRKPSTDGFGFPCTALVEITEERVSGQYTPSGTDEPYWQHHYL